MHHVELPKMAYKRSGDTRDEYACSTLQRGRTMTSMIIQPPTQDEPQQAVEQANDGKSPLQAVGLQPWRLGGLAEV